MPPRRRRRRSSPLPTLTVLALALVAVVVVARLGTERPAPPLAVSTPRHVATPLGSVATPTVPAVATTMSAPPATAAPTPLPPVTPVATPAASTASGARLAIIVDDCGQWPVTERAFVALPIPLTLSVLPHVRYGATIAREAAAAGKGVMLHLPMETLSGKYPGPGEITTAMDDAAIDAELRGDLADVPLARGVNNHEGSRATADPRVMNDIAGVLAADGRYFIDSRTSAASVAESVMREHGIPSARRNVFLDDVDDVAAVEGELRRAAALARSGGSAIAIGHPRAATLAAVRALLPALEAEGITFVLASDLVH